VCGNNVYACYWNPDSQKVYYGTWGAEENPNTSTCISIRDKIGDTDDVYEISLNADSGQPWISVYWKKKFSLFPPDPLPYKLSYGTSTNGTAGSMTFNELWTWPFDTIKAYDDIGLAVFSSTSLPCVVYAFQNAAFQKNLWYQMKLSTAMGENKWSENKIVEGLMPDSSAIAVDTRDQQQVIYTDNTSKKVVYLHGQGAETPVWTTGFSAAPQGEASSSVIALEGSSGGEDDHNVHMAYIDGTQIQHIWKYNGAWINQSWTNSRGLTPSAGISLSLKAPSPDDDDGPHISCIKGGKLKCFGITGKAEIK